MSIILLLTVALAGFFMARWVGEKRTGIRAAAAYFLLIFVPYLALFVFLAVNVDPAIEPSRRLYNVMLAFDIVAIVFTLPWLAALLAGGIAGARRRRLGQSSEEGR
jgi:Kef-type K+ transport system membrane component KefB